MTEVQLFSLDGTAAKMIYFVLGPQRETLEEAFGVMVGALMRDREEREALSPSGENG